MLNHSCFLWICYTSLQEHARKWEWVTYELWYQHDKRQTVSSRDGFSGAERDTILATRNLSYPCLQGRPAGPSVTCSTKWRQGPFLLWGRKANRFFFFILKSQFMCHSKFTLSLPQIPSRFPYIVRLPTFQAKFQIIAASLVVFLLERKFQKSCLAWRNPYENTQ